MGDERLAIREDVLKLITSNEAERATRYLSLIFLRMVRAPHHLWERENVLRFTGEVREGRHVTAREQFLALVKVSSGTAKKAVDFLQREGVITFYADDDRREIVIYFVGHSGDSAGR